MACPTSGADGVFSVVAVTEHQPNGLAADWNTNILYFTDEGSLTKSKLLS